MSINEEIATKITRVRKSKPGEFHKKLVKSHYGSRDEIIKRAEFMFNEYLQEMDRHPDNGDPPRRWIRFPFNYEPRPRRINQLHSNRRIHSTERGR
jgi:hypothetical protein